MRKLLLAAAFAAIAATATIAQTTDPAPLPPAASTQAVTPAAAQAAVPAPSSGSAPLADPAAAPTAAQPSPIVPGRYEGALDIGGGQTMPLVLRILEGGGGLVDLPVQNLYGYPLSGIAITGGHLAFILGMGDAGDGSSIRFDADAKDPSGQPLRLEGSWSQNGTGSSFSLAWAPPPDTGDIPLAVKVKGGALRGSLLLPRGEGPFPLVVLVGGAGATDRDGNNYNVPGRCDSMRSLAFALRDLGVATYRYDKRGAGESYVLGGGEADLVFGDYVDDAAAVIRSFRGDARFARLVVAGHTEGGLVAAAAVRRLSDEGLMATAAAAGTGGGVARGIDGLILLCASGRTAVETVEAGLADLPAELKAEAGEIMDSLKAGKPWPSPSDYFADFFRPSFQPYLISWFGFDIRKELASTSVPLLIVQGDYDFQVTLSEAFLLAQARPDAAAVVIPGMNHVLKEVPQELDENYRSFSDPSFPLGAGLPALVASFARGEALPEGLPRFDGGAVR
jgi:pimeloyl-ACP methyl ester carboxylesterase